MVLRLINREKNRELLKEIPHIPFLDLEIVFMLLLGQNGKGQMSAMVSKGMMQEWGESPQGLLSEAQKNTPLLSPARLESMEDVMKKIAKSNLGEDYEEDLVTRILREGQEEDFVSLYVLTNQQGIYGAAAMLYPGLLKDFAES